MRQAVLCGVAVLCIITVFGSDETAYCASGYTQPVASNWPLCYKVYPQLKFRKDALAQCKADNGTLASVPNAFVNSYLYTLATEHQMYYMTLGIQCPNKEKNTCVNDDGTSVTYNNFKFGEPNTVNGNGVTMSIKKMDAQKWETYYVDNAMAFACEIPAGVVQDYDCPQDYINFEGVCYKFVNTHVHNLSGNDASAECKKVPGGTLATIDNAEVNSFLIAQAPRRLYQTAFGLRCPNVTKDGDMSSCQWDDGTPFGYNAFLSELENGRWWWYPLAAGKGGCCWFNNGKWSDCADCDDHQFDSYICQAPEQAV